MRGTVGVASFRSCSRAGEREGARACLTRDVYAKHRPGGSFGLSLRDPQTEAADEELLGAVASGDESALAQLYDRYSAILFGLLLRILRDRGEAQDVLQEVFLRTWQRARDFDASRGRVLPWLSMLARSRALDRLRSLGSRSRAAAEAAREPGESVGDGADQAIASENGRRVRRALAEIPEAQREALRLAYFEGLTQAEIAVRLARPLGTVKTQMRLGLTKLRDLLREEGER